MLAPVLCVRVSLSKEADGAEFINNIWSRKYYRHASESEPANAIIGGLPR